MYQISYEWDKNYSTLAADKLTSLPHRKKGSSCPFENVEVEIQCPLERNLLTKFRTKRKTTVTSIQVIEWHTPQKMCSNGTGGKQVRSQPSKFKSRIYLTILERNLYNKLDIRIRKLWIYAFDCTTEWNKMYIIQIPAPKFLKHTKACGWVEEKLHGAGYGICFLDLLTYKIYTTIQTCMQNESVNIFYLV